ncbi:MAG: FtsW/RodA/SpoVE family cell cycle protein, partial [Candidatus Puniceispirillaceae bacterium]
MSLWRTLFRIPWHIIVLSLLLVAIGAMALYSASEGSWQPWAGRHAMRGAFGVGVVLVMAFVDFKILHRLSYFMLIAAIAVLVALLVIGSGPNVARWISIGGVSFQPSEPAKIAIILALARYFDSQPQDRMQSLIVYLPAIGMIAIPFLLGAYWAQSRYPQLAGCGITCPPELEALLVAMNISKFEER